MTKKLSQSATERMEVQETVLLAGSDEMHLCAGAGSQCYSDSYGYLDSQCYSDIHGDSASQGISGIQGFLGSRTARSSEVTKKLSQSATEKKEAQETVLLAGSDEMHLPVGAGSHGYSDIYGSSSLHGDSANQGISDIHGYLSSRTARSNELTKKLSQNAIEKMEVQETVLLARSDELYLSAGVGSQGYSDSYGYSDSQGYSDIHGYSASQGISGIHGYLSSRTARSNELTKKLSQSATEKKEAQETVLLAGSDEMYLCAGNETIHPSTNSFELIQDIVYIQDTTKIN
ncbi:MAG: hypothetical protein K2P39_15840 [Lachnospiraceae bacterium]|nr:hypothetical protein [Lachnospiraceae bacterium]